MCIRDRGVGAGYTLGAGIRAGGEQWYLDFKDSLYVGYSQVMVTRNASRIQNRYQNEYGAYGRTQYKKDIQAALDSGTLDEKMCIRDKDYIIELEQKPKALREALLLGKWDAFDGQAFPEFADDPAHYEDGLYTQMCIRDSYLPLRGRCQRS